MGADEPPHILNLCPVFFLFLSSNNFINHTIQTQEVFDGEGENTL
jgi:hypothetical protein